MATETGTQGWRIEQLQAVKSWLLVESGRLDAIYDRESRHGAHVRVAEKTADKMNYLNTLLYMVEQSIKAVSEAQS